jgi:hypothetical protein
MRAPLRILGRVDAPHGALADQRLEPEARQDRVRANRRRHSLERIVARGLVLLKHLLRQSGFRDEMSRL